MKTLADRVRYARMRLGLSQIEVDRRLGKSGNYVTRIESGERQAPRVDSAKALADALEVDMLWLVSGVGATPPPIRPTSQCVALLPHGKLLEELPEPLQEVLVSDAIPPEHRDQIPALVTMFFKDGHTMTAEKWVAMAATLHRLGQGADAEERAADEAEAEIARRQEAARSRPLPSKGKSPGKRGDR